MRNVCASLLFVCLFLLVSVRADTAANCFVGTWHYTYSDVQPQGKNTNCSLYVPTQHKSSNHLIVKLSEPNVAEDELGNVGNWTLVYNQGVEVWLSGRIWFAFSWTDAAGDFDCTRTVPGWVHDMEGKEWRCFIAQQEADSQTQVKSASPSSSSPLTAFMSDRRTTTSPRYRSDPTFVASLNAAQSWWQAKEYPELVGRKLEHINRRRGTKTLPVDVTSLPPLTPEKQLELLAAYGNRSIPDAFDWRDVDGVNYLSPVRDQGTCGSCYSFSSAGQLEARIRIASGNKQQPILSPQDVLSCSEYAQGCEGGFPYLTAGKYAFDFGMLAEDCYPYVGVDSACSPNPQPSCNPQRWHSNEYYYVGGYYGAATIELIQMEILTNGPVSVSMMAYPDLDNYSSGVYVHNFTAHIKSELNPFELVNHSVLMVGWGTTENGISYWIVKNSWSTSWGENGYFRILRGSSEPGGECAIESIPLAAIPILH